MSTLNPLPAIKLSFQQAMLNQSLEGVKHVFVSGSVARGQFYPGWSDVDVIIVANETMQKGTIDALAAWRFALAQDLGCKVGTDYVSLERLRLCLEESDCQVSYLSECLHFMKNFHESNAHTLSAGTLYQNPVYTVRLLTSDKYQGLKIESYLYDLQEQVYETLLRADKAPGGVHAIRILTKACLYLLQTSLLVSTGKLVTCYTDVPSQCRNLFTQETAPIETIYRLLEEAKYSGTVASEQFDPTVEQQLLECFDSLLREALERSHAEQPIHHLSLV